jgi:hypothetical protein
MRLIGADELKSKFLEMGCIDGKPCYGAEIIDRMPTVQAVPIEELKRLNDAMDNTLCKTDGERHILWTCQAMLADCIESYEGSDKE